MFAITHGFRVLALLGCAAGWVTSCATPPAADLREVYRDAAFREPRNPVVVIHGTLGARLIERDGGKLVWGAFTRDAIDVRTPDGARSFAVPRNADGSVTQFAAGTEPVLATGPVGTIDVDLFFGVISVDVYAQILRTLGIGGYADRVYLGPEYPEEHFTCHSFFYDWRQDNVQSAIALSEYLDATRTRIEQHTRAKIARLRLSGSETELQHADRLQAWLLRGVRFDIVAHSMGGLIARYYLRFGGQPLPADGSTPTVTWAGAQHVDSLVMVGTPNGGAVDALKELISGTEFGPFLPKYHHAMLGTMPSVYQLLPHHPQRVLRDKHGQPVELDYFDVQTWEDAQWGLLNPNSAQHLQWLMPELEEPSERLARARSILAYSLSRARQFHSALDQHPAEPCPVEMRLFAADSLPTLASALVIQDRSGRAQLRFDEASCFSLGDSTVTRASALGDMRLGGESRQHALRSPIAWTSVSFISDDHVGLTANPSFTNNLLFYLLEQDRR